MCGTCGCEEHEHNHHHDHDHEGKSLEVSIAEGNLLGANDKQAMFVRGWLTAKKIFAINMVSSPGSGKTSILEATFKYLKDKCKIGVIEGDQQTDNDAKRILSHGVKAVQINTQSGCHLDANLVWKAIEELQLSDQSLLFIENVGNLVCPAMFDLGENKRTVVLSVTEGDDKPLKYPYMFAHSDVCIINKTDLLPYVPCDIYALKENCLKVNPHLKIFEMSAYTGEGVENWCKYILEEISHPHNHTIRCDTQFFDTMAVNWDKTSHHDLGKIEFLLSKIGLNSGDKVLDVGTGTGILIPFLASAVGSTGGVTAVDASEKMIEVAKTKFGSLKTVKFDVADIENVQIPGTFDHIVMLSVYPHLNRPVDTVLSLIKHHLAPGGNLMIAHTQSREHINSLHAQIKNDLVSLDLPAVEMLASDFESRGLKVVDMLDNENYYYIILSNKKD